MDPGRADPAKTAERADPAKTAERADPAKTAEDSNPAESADPAEVPGLYTFRASVRIPLQIRPTGPGDVLP